MADQPSLHASPHASLPDPGSRNQAPAVLSDPASSGKRLALVLLLFLFAASAVAAVDVWRARFVPIHRFEATAVHGLRTIAQAEQQYKSSYPQIGYARSLSALVGDPAQGPPSPDAAHILRNLDFMYGLYSGYGSTVAQCRRQSRDAPDKVTG